MPRYRMRKFLINTSLLLCFLPAVVLAQKNEAKSSPGGWQDPFEGALAYLIGISVRDIVKQQKWYSDNFGLEVLKVVDLPERGIALRVLGRGRIRIELIRNNVSVPRRSLANDSTNSTSVQGIFKFSLLVQDVDKAAQYFRDHGVQLVSPPFVDEKDRSKYFLIRDPEGNTIQIFEILP